MPDISMCLNKKCELRKKCYRFTAEPSQYRQSYANFKPEKKGEIIICEHQIKITNSENK